MQEYEFRPQTGSKKASRFFQPGLPVKARNKPGGKTMINAIEIS